MPNSNNLKKCWILFIIIIIISFFFRIKIIHELPLGIETTSYGLIGFDDEPAHVNYTKFLLKNKKLPVLKNKITDPDALEINEFEYHQPPLYYLLVALAGKTFSLDSDRSILLLGRYLSFILFLISGWVFFEIFKSIKWETHKTLALLAVFALLGSSVYQFSLFNNDGLSWLLMWTIFLLVIRGMSKNWILLILLITLSHYTKSSILVYYPVLIWAGFYTVKKYPGKNTYLKVTSVFIVPLILASPWYIRNQMVYGHFFALSTITGEKWYFVTSLKESILRIMHMPYGFFFRMHFEPPKFVLSWFNIIPYIWASYAGLYWLKQIRDEIKTNYHLQLISILTFSMILAYIYYALPTGYTEGRLLYPALPGFLYILTTAIFPQRLKYKLPEYTQILAILIVLLPSYIIGFYTG